MGQRGYGAAEAVASCRITASPCWREGASCRALCDRSLWSMPHSSQSASHRAAHPRPVRRLVHPCGQLALSGRIAGSRSAREWALRLAAHAIYRCHQPTTRQRVGGFGAGTCTVHHTVHHTVHIADNAHLVGLAIIATNTDTQICRANRYALRQRELTTQSTTDSGRFSVRASSSLRPAPNEQARFQLKAALVDCALGDAIFANGFEGSAP